MTSDGLRKKTAESLTAGIRLHLPRCLTILAISVFTLGGGWQAQADSRESCLSQSGKEAIPPCRTLLDQGGNDLAIMRHLADAYIKEELFDEALVVLDRTRKAYPDARRLNHTIELAKSLQAEQLLFAEDDNEIGAKPPATQSAKTNSRLNRLLCLKLKGERGLAACAEVVDENTSDQALLQAYASLLTTAGKKNQAAKLLARIEAPEATGQAEQQKAALPQTPTEKTNVAKPVATSPPAPAPAPAPAVAVKEQSVADQLRELKALYEEKLIDELEYGKRKALLMDKAFGRTPAGTVTADLAPSASPGNVDFGNYHALVIGVQEYQFLTRLEMALNDARGVAALLESHYGYRVSLLENPTRKEILLALGKMRRTLGKGDNLLIYYAGHGWLDEEADAGYWLPVDAAQDNDIEWLSLNAIISAARAIPAKHLMIVADSCFSGKLTRGLNIQMKTTDHLRKMASRKARVVLTSGGLEPVLDSGGGNHSVFAAAFLSILRENNEILDATSLFSQLRREVLLRANQTPEYSDIRKAGHEGGDYLFIRTKRGG